MKIKLNLIKFNDQGIDISGFFEYEIEKKYFFNSSNKIKFRLRSRAYN